MGGHKTVHGAYRHRYAPFLVHGMAFILQKGGKPLSVTCGDNSPKGRAKGGEEPRPPCHSEPVTEVTGVGIRNLRLPLTRSVAVIPACFLNVSTLSGFAALSHLPKEERQGMLARYTGRCIKAHHSAMRNTDGWKNDKSGDATRLRFCR